MKQENGLGPKKLSYNSLQALADEPIRSLSKAKHFEEDLGNKSPLTKGVNNRLSEDTNDKKTTEQEES